jgi:hypothetical protein
MGDSDFQGLQIHPVTRDTNQNGQVFMRRRTGTGRRATPCPQRRPGSYLQQASKGNQGRRASELVEAGIQVFLVVGVGGGEFVDVLRGQRAGLVVLAGPVVAEVGLVGLVIPPRIRLAWPELAVLRHMLARRPFQTPAPVAHTIPALTHATPTLQLLRHIQQHARLDRGRPQLARVNVAIASHLLGLIT